MSRKSRRSRRNDARPPVSSLFGLLRPHLFLKRLPSPNLTTPDSVTQIMKARLSPELMLKRGPTPQVLERAFIVACTRIQASSELPATRLLSSLMKHIVTGEIKLRPSERLKLYRTSLSLPIHRQEGTTITDHWVRETHIKHVMLDQGYL